MLGKQGWRLMTRPASLCAKVLKGRYYPDGDFLSCTRKKRSSHTWRAIMVGREALAQGIIRRIGNGTSTNTWHDRWLPNHLAGVPLTPGDGQDVSMVSDLLTASGHWNEDLIRSIFIPVDAEAIIRIPVRIQDDDVWAWEPETWAILCEVCIQNC